MSSPETAVERRVLRLDQPNPLPQKFTDFYGVILTHLEDGLPVSSSNPAAPESRTPLSMRHDEDFGPRFPDAKHEVKGESAETRPAQASIERLETVRGDSDEFDQAIHLIEKPARRAQTALGVPLDGFLRVPHGSRVKSDLCWHQARRRVRS
jgi:hypothetical protein